jgi:photosystem II stability/assembly factor-like uncharacterized protein
MRRTKKELTMNIAKLWSAGSISTRILLFAGVIALSGASCESCGGGGGGSGGTSSGGGGGWLVGTKGLMINVTMAEPPSVVGYKLALLDDLRGIACRGDKEAWVVGNAGVLIATDDGGETWRAFDSGVKSPLRAVSLATDSHVFIAGESGVLRFSRNRGVDWTTVQAPPVTWTSIAARRSDGAAALLATSDGHIYHLDAVGGLLSQVGAIPVGALHSVVMSRDGAMAVAVGDGGNLLVSDNGGIDWRTRASGTDQPLRDVWLDADTKSVTAVGDGGLVVQASLRDDAAPVVRTLGDFTFRGIHLEASGHGTIVGDRGAAFVTHDYGQTWDQVNTGETRDILGVDALQVGGHL